MIWWVLPMLWLVLYLCTIVGANALHAEFGFIPLGLGLTASAGVLSAGLAFTARDIVQESMGRASAIVAIVAGAALSVLVAPNLALASGAAFLVSELVDFAVYTPLRVKHWIAAVVLSNTVGATVDSALFLHLAFGSTELLVGQTVGKVAMTVAVLPFLFYYRTHRHA